MLNEFIKEFEDKITNNLGGKDYINIQILNNTVKVSNFITSETIVVIAVVDNVAKVIEGDNSLTLITEGDLIKLGLLQYDRVMSLIKQTYNQPTYKLDYVLDKSHDK